MAQGKRNIPISRLAELNKQSLLDSLEKTKKEYFANKELKKFIVDWCDKNDFPASEMLGGKLSQLIEEIEITNFKNENKIRSWNHKLNH